MNFPFIQELEKDLTKIEDQLKQKKANRNAAITRRNNEIVALAEYITSELVKFLEGYEKCKVISEPKNATIHGHVFLRIHLDLPCLTKPTNVSVSFEFPNYTEFLDDKNESFNIRRKYDGLLHHPDNLAEYKAINASNMALHLRNYILETIKTLAYERLRTEYADVIEQEKKKR